MKRILLLIYLLVCTSVMEMTGQVYEISKSGYQSVNHTIRTSTNYTRHFSTSTYLQPRTRYVSSTIFNLSRYNTVPVMYQDGTIYRAGQQSLPAVGPRRVRIYNDNEVLDTGRDDDYEGDHYYGYAAIGHEHRWFWRDRNGHIYYWDDDHWNPYSLYNIEPESWFNRRTDGPLPKEHSSPLNDGTAYLLLLISGYSFYRLKISSNFYI